MVFLISSKKIVCMRVCVCSVLVSHLIHICSVLVSRLIQFACTISKQMLSERKLALHIVCL